MTSFYDHFLLTPLGEIFGDHTPVSIDDPCMNFLRPPPEGFLRYACERRRAPFDGVPPDPESFRNDPTFFITQVHRLWLMLATIQDHVPLSPGSLLVDLGAFPFSLAIALREYMDYRGRILATVNQELKPEWQASLGEHAIELAHVNLDPHVTPSMPGLSPLLPLPENSVDAILFTHVIEHLYHPRTVLEECARVLKPGGRLLLSTDNAYMLGAFLNFLDPQPYLHEPVEGTAAMIFTEWRGHVRFFSEGDLHVLCRAAGLSIVSSRLYEVLYHSFLESYFVHPQRSMPAWRARLLAAFPAYRNEIIQVLEKPVPANFNPS